MSYTLKSFIIPSDPSLSHQPLVRFLYSIFILCESLFFLTIFWQTRLNLSHIRPDILPPPIVSDYLIPFLYLSQVFFGLTLALWLIIYRRPLVRSISRLLSPAFRPRQLSLSILKYPQVWLIVALILTIFSLILNQPQWWNWFKLAHLVAGLIITLYLYARLRQGLAWRLLALLCLGAVIQQFLILYQWIFQSSLGLQWLGEWRTSVYTPGVAKVVIEGHEYLRPFGTFAHPNIAGVILALVWLPGLALIKHSKETPNVTINVRWLYALWTIFSFISILVTFSRLAWLVLALQALLLVMIVRPHLSQPVFYRQHKCLLGLGLSFIIITSTIFILPRLGSLTTYDHLSIDRRVQLNVIAFDQVKNHPLWGIGLSNHIIALYQYGPLYGVGIWRQPVHNIYLLAASEIGLPAALAWMMVVLTSLYNLCPICRSISKPKPLIAGLLLGWFSVALVGLFDHFWLTVYPATLTLFVFLAITHYVARVGGTAAKLHRS